MTHDQFLKITKYPKKARKDPLCAKGIFTYWDMIHIVRKGRWTTNKSCERMLILSMIIQHGGSVIKDDWPILFKYPFSKNIDKRLKELSELGFVKIGNDESITLDYDKIFLELRHHELEDN